MLEIATAELVFELPTARIEGRPKPPMSAMDGQRTSAHLLVAGE
jgi:hypothetical protein